MAHSVQRVRGDLHNPPRRSGQSFMFTIMTIPLEDEVKSPLDRLADSTQRNKSFLAPEAIREVVENNERQLAETRAALKETDGGDFASDKDAAAVARRWKQFRVRWPRTALRNRDAEASRIAVDDPAAARLVVARVLQAVAQLADQPGLGRPGRVPGAREPVAAGTRYGALHYVKGENLRTLRVLHTSGTSPDRG